MTGWLLASNFRLIDKHFIFSNTSVFKKLIIQTLLDFFVTLHDKQNQSLSSGSLEVGPHLHRPFFENPENRLATFWLSRVYHNPVE